MPLGERHRGRLGPDLSGVGWVRSATHLRVAIVAPDDHIDENYRQVRVMTRAGAEQRAMKKPDRSEAVSVYEGPDPAGKMEIPEYTRCEVIL